VLQPNPIRNSDFPLIQLSKSDFLSILDSILQRGIRTLGGFLKPNMERIDSWLRYPSNFLDAVITLEVAADFKHAYPCNPKQPNSSSIAEPHP